MKRAIVLLLSLCSASVCAKRDLSEGQLITTPAGDVAVVKLTINHGYGLFMVKATIANNTGKNWRNFKLQMLASDSSGHVEPREPQAQYFTLAKWAKADTAKLVSDFHGTGHVDAKSLAVQFKFVSGDVVESLVQPGCPVDVIFTDPLAIIFGTRDPWGSEMKIGFKNISDKAITAEKFGVDFFDVTGDVVKSAFEYTADLTVRPGEISAPHWEDGVYVHELGRNIKARAWPVKILYADGSSWADDGSKKCEE